MASKRKQGAGELGIRAATGRCEVQLSVAAACEVERRVAAASVRCSWACALGCGLLTGLRQRVVQLEACATCAAGACGLKQGRTRGGTCRSLARARRNLQELFTREGGLGRNLVRTKERGYCEEFVRGSRGAVWAAILVVFFYPKVGKDLK
ncbi:unnamed protein product [Dovyalis caffra]|uniref:Uncharacterized protein n=1 Tax=Dovyalis caffra TaxID=77055 RepID=A0AAV1RQ57_9ROSI|nr:unnamed protein product [Dovyalis caffra]